MIVHTQIHTKAEIDVEKFIGDNLTMSHDSYGAFQTSTLLPFSESAQQKMAEWPLPFLTHPHLTGS